MTGGEGQGKRTRYSPTCFTTWAHEVSKLGGGARQLSMSARFKPGQSTSGLVVSFPGLNDIGGEREV